MEKRVILAFLLSFAVFAFWGKMFPPEQAEERAESPQVVANKEFTTKGPTSHNGESDGMVQESVAKKVSEEEVVLENDRLKVIFSNYGGRLVRADLVQYRDELPIKNIFSIPTHNNISFQIQEKSSRSVVFSAKQGGREIKKTYSISDEEYIVYADVRVTNTGSEPIEALQITAMHIDMEDISEEIRESRDKNLQEYSVYTDDGVFRKTGAYQFSEKNSKKEIADVHWMGFRNRYHCVIIAPDFPTSGYTIDPKGEKTLTLNMSPRDNHLASLQSQSWQGNIYIGPQKGSVLSQYEPEFEKIHVYFRWGLFNGIAKVIEKTVILIHKVIPNWGVSIVLVSILIYLLLSPLTIKSMLSMRKMQKLQPEITKLREKYGSDSKNAQKLNQEIMKLYSENRVNPLGGCLPLLFQMPIFIGLYQVLWRSVLFKGADFLWIKDLSEPDRLIIFDRTFPFIGNELNILPLIMVVLMFFQQKMSSKNMSATDPNQVTQQKMMMYIFPVFLGFIFYKFASGLSLYFTVFYGLSIFTQWRVANKAAKE